MYRVELSFGHCQQTGEPVPAQHVAAAEQQVLEVFSEAFGGGQVYHRLGGYVGGGHPMQEASSVVWSYGERVNMQQLWSLASAIARLLNQESILLAVVPVRGTVQWIGPHSLLEQATAYPPLDSVGVV
jgi:hypothetical protein